MAREEKQSIEVTQIRLRIDDWATSFRSKDIEGVMVRLRAGNRLLRPRASVGVRGNAYRAP
jgi:hypothetical protein